MDQLSLNALSGWGSPSDYDLLTGGMYSNAAGAVDNYDNGTLNTNVTGPGTGTSTYTPPSFLSNLLSFAGQASNLVTTVAPLINGQPANSPQQLAAKQGNGAVSPNPLVAGIGGISWAAILVVGGIIAAIVFLPKLLKRSKG